ncbi:MAG: hypothetical protein JXA72_09355 [Bacteroidales bacterium]|nr:hypothetical protein [Bacteroidales bacterium]
MKLLSFRNLLLILAISTMSLFSCNKEDEVTLDFEITLPEKWVGTVYANEGIVYQAARIKQYENDTIGEWLTVFKEPLSDQFNLNIYYTALKDKITSFENDYFISAISEKDTTINATDFKRLITNELEPYLTSMQDTVDLNRIVTRYFFFEKNNGYYFTMSCQDTSFYRYKPVFDDIMSSFQYKY